VTTAAEMTPLHGVQRAMQHAGFDLTAVFP
jgi:hypothetical protein